MHSSLYTLDFISEGGISDVVEEVSFIVCEHDVALCSANDESVI